MGIKRLRCSVTKRRGIEDSLTKLQETGLLDHRMGSGRPHTLRSCNISAISFSQGSARTLLMWGDHVFHVSVKMFFVLTAVQIL